MTLIQRPNSPAVFEAFGTVADYYLALPGYRLASSAPGQRITITKAGQLSTVEVDTFGYWAARGWSLDENADKVPDVLAGSTPGGGTDPATTARVDTLETGLAAVTTRTGARAVGQGEIALSVKDYGAKGDGVTDDRPAIQAALDAGGNGAAVYFPPGLYALKTATLPGSRILKLYPNQTLTGAGRYASTLKLGATFGDYVTVLGMATDSTYCGRLVLSDLGVDQNAAGGNQLTIATQSTYPRAALRALSYTAGSSVTVTKCAFLNTDSINTLYIGADVQEVSSCHFLGQGGPVGTAYHDHSTVYLTTTVTRGTQTITGNTFRGVAGSGGAITAIETHGGSQAISSNVIADYVIGANLTGVSSIVTDGITFTGNTLTGVCVGVTLWAWYYSTLTTGTACRNTIIAGNTVTIDRDVWVNIPGFLAYAYGVLVNYDNSAPVEGLSIERNLITYLPSTVALTNDANSCGIRIQVASNTAEVRDLRIVHNTINSPLSAGIFLAATIKRAIVEKNIITNPGQSTDASVVAVYRSAIVLSRTLADASFERNLLVDDRAPHRAEYNIICSGVTAAVGCSTSGNTTRYTDGAVPFCTFIPQSGGTSANAFLIEEAGPTASLPFYGVKPGSTVRDTSTGKRWTQITPVTGTAYIMDWQAAGAPEGVVTAPPGSTYRRTDGAAATSFYVKETGVGNTGWVAK